MSDYTEDPTFVAVMAGDRSVLGEGERVLDIPLLRKTIEHIEAHPEEHSQEHWRCETGACYAGTGALIAGAEWDLNGAEGPAEWDYVNVSGPLGEHVHVSDYAQRAMGLSHAEANRMFDQNNTAADLRAMVDALDERGHLAGFGVLYGDGGSDWQGF